jgi:hypothetical protein
MKIPFAPVRLLALAVTAFSMTSCSNLLDLPAPYDVQYDHRGLDEPRATRYAPYRSTYQSNRYMKADYSRHSGYRYSSVEAERPVKRVSSSKERERRERETELAQIASPMAPAAAPAPMKTEPATVATAPAPAKPKTLPFGISVEGKPGMVHSPYGDQAQLVDVSGMAAGDTVKDPYNGQLFRVPATALITVSKPIPATEPKAPEPTSANVGAATKP